MHEYRITEEEAEKLVSWYKGNKRDLPWRNTGNPYHIWLSEIMLQQTRVEAVRERFVQFLRELPDIPSLASVSDDQLMKLWEGMGYYSRARNLKKCAQVLVMEYDGRLPEDPSLLVKLPGIGSYTAGAIAAQAYGNPVPAVDGNVLRVLARLFNCDRDIRKDETKKEAQAVIEDFYAEEGKTLAEDPSFVSAFTQGLMELGAIVCVPNGAPHCDACPWCASCKAHLENTTDMIPYRSPLKERKLVQRTIFIIRDGSRFFLQKRPDKGLLAGLYEFPGVDKWLDEKQAVAFAEKQGWHVLHVHRLPDARHVFTHLEWQMKAYELQVDGILADERNDVLLLTKKELQSFAVPSAFKAYKQYYELNA